MKELCHGLLLIFVSEELNSRSSEEKKKHSGKCFTHIFLHFKESGWTTSRLWLLGALLLTLFSHLDVTCCMDKINWKKIPVYQIRQKSPLKVNGHYHFFKTYLSDCCWTVLEDNQLTSSDFLSVFYEFHATKDKIMPEHFIVKCSKQVC